MKKTILLNLILVLISFSMQAQTAPLCGDKFYDTGGPDNNYSDNEDYSLLILADDPANFVSINFLELAVENGFDFLRIYDGDDANAPELTPSGGAQTPGTYTSTVAGGNLYVTFISDHSSTRAGWNADIICSPNPPCVPPTGLLLIGNSETTAAFSWNAESEATNGYLLSVYEEGADPTLDTAVYSEAIPSGTLTATATGLEGGTRYDAYIGSDCGGGTISNTNKLNFNTAYPDPVCGGKFYDTGGPDGEFQNNEDYFVTISPDETGDLVTATFVFVENTMFDKLTVDIGDGVAQTVPEIPLGADPISYTSIAPDGVLLFHFISSAINPNPGWEADITCAPAPTCPAPTDFTVNDTTPTTATFSWEEVTVAVNGYTLSVFLEDEDPNTATPVYTEIISSGTLSGTATGLTEATTYDAYITADCDTDGISSMSKVTFFTPPTPPVCGGKFYDTGGPDGDFENNEDYMVTILPDSPGDIVTATFTFVNNSQFDVLTVDIGDGIPQVVPEILAGDPPIAYTSVAANGSLVFTFVSTAITTNPGWEADITCASAPCPQVENFVTTEILSNSATFTWDIVIEASNGYQLTVFNEGDSPDIGVPVYSEAISEGINTATATGLEANSNYDAYLTSNCDSNNSDEVMITFTTLDLGLDDLKTQSLNYYPNPTSGLVHFKSKSIVDFIEVYNMLGQKVMSLHPNTSDFNVDFSTLNTGTYLIKTSIKDNLAVYRIIKN